MAKDITLIDAQTATSGSGTIAMQNYDHAIIHARCTTGGGFDLAVTATPTEISGDTGVSIVPAGTDVTDVSDIRIDTGRIGDAKITVSYSNLSNNSVSAHTITAATGYVDGSNVNTNSTLTTDAGPRTGTLTRALTGLNCAPGADIDQITFASAAHSGDTGKTLTVANSATAGNNTTYSVTYVSATAFDCVGNFTAPDTQVITPAMTAILSDALVGPTVAPSPDMDRLTCASAFIAADTGRQVTIANSADAGNDATYAMTYVSATAVDVGVPFSSADDQTETPAMTATINTDVPGVTIAPGGDLDRVQSGPAFFAAGDVGRSIVVSGSATPANDGTYTIGTYIDANNVDVTTNFSATDTGGALVVKLQLVLTSVELVGGMRRLSATGEFAAGDVGRSVAVTGSADSDNNGSYTIASFVDADNVELAERFASSDTGGTLAVTVSQTLSTVALAPGTDYTKITSGSDMFSTYDPGRTIVIASGANAGTYTVDTFTSATEIDVVETFPAITTGTAGTLTGTITGIDTAPGGDADRVHTATAQFAEVDEGATLSIAGSTWPITVYVRLWTEGSN